MQVLEWSHVPRIHAADELGGPIPDGFDDGVVEACEPAVYVALHENHFGVRVRGDEFLGEGGSRYIGYGGVVAEELIPFRFGEFWASIEEFGVEGGTPCGTILDAAEEGEGMETWEVEDVEGCVHGCGRWLSRYSDGCSECTGGASGLAGSRGFGCPFRKLMGYLQAVPVRI